MAATSNPAPCCPFARSPRERIHQAWKKTWLAWLGIYPTLRASLVSPNPGEQAWTISPVNLPPQPLVLSLGLAENLSFDWAMIRDFGSVVHGFDPTPTTRKWMNQNPMPTDFHFHAVAVAGHDGWLDLAERVGKGGKQRGPVFLRAPCRRISSICGDLGLARIDILKMDIEGSEYSVLQDILPHGIFPSQITVEFHHRFEEIGIQKTRLAHQALLHHGYRLAHISPWAEEFLYLRQENSCR